MIHRVKEDVATRQAVKLCPSRDDPEFGWGEEFRFVVGKIRMEMDRHEPALASNGFAQEPPKSRGFLCN